MIQRHSTAKGGNNPD